MNFDTHKNLITTTILVGPADPTAGTELFVAPEVAAMITGVPYNGTISPPFEQATYENSEIVRITAVNPTTGELTMEREQEGTSAIQIATGYTFAMTITAKVIEDVEKSLLDLQRTITGDNYQYERGISMSGMEFSPTQLPGTAGTHFFTHKDEDYAYVASKGATIVRLAVLWERMQPTLNGALDATYMGYIDQNIAWAKKYGMRIVLEPHNFGRRGVGGVERIIGSAELPITAFANLWSRLAQRYVDEPTIFMYDLMNEPHDMPVPTTPSNYRNSGIVQLISNPSIEPNATGWTLEADFTVVTNEHYNGSHSIKQVSVDGYANFFNTQAIYVEPNTDYVLSFYHKTQSAGSFDYNTPFVQINDGAADNPYGTNIAQAQTAIVNPDVWQRFVLPFNSGTSTKIFVRVFNNNQAVTAYYDGFNLTEGTTPQAFTTDIGSAVISTVTLMNQAAIDAIRAVDQFKYIAIEPDYWAGLQTFTSQYGANPQIWWNDPANRTMLSWHYYFDNNHSGSYANDNAEWSPELRSRIEAEVTPALDWADANNVITFVGEYGVPNTDSTDGANWRTDMDTFLSILDDYKAYATHWASGAFYGSPTTLQPVGALNPGTDYSVDQSQATVVFAHPSVSRDPITRHNELQGLNADDHLIYHTDARGDVRYYRKAEVDALIAAIGGGSGISNLTVGTEPPTSPLLNHVWIKVQ